MILMDDALLDLHAEGKITADEAVARAVNPADVRNALGIS